MRTLVLEDVPLPVPRVPPPLVRPEGPLSFDWAMAEAIRPQIDEPDPAWLERLGRLTGPVARSRRRIYFLHGSN